jgi:hypothetical protein
MWKYYLTYLGHLDISKLLKQESLEHFTDEVSSIVKLVETGNSVMAVGAPKIGIGRILGLLNAFFQQSSNYKVLYDSDNIFSIKDIKKFIDSSRNRKVIIILPYLYLKDESYFSEFDELLLEYKKSKIIVLSHGSFELIQNPYKYFKKSIVPISFVKFVKTLNLNQTRTNIQRIKDKYGIKIPKKVEKVIFELSGGHTGLIKRLCQYYSINGNLYLNQLLVTPSIIFSIEQILDSIKNINKEILIQSGLIDQKGNYVSRLIQSFTSKDTKSLINLQGNLKTIFDVFIDNKNTVVSIEMLQDRLDEFGDKTLWSIYKTITRLRKEIKDQYRLVSLKGRGYILKDK